MTALFPATKWRSLGLELRCALLADGFTQARWDRLSQIKRELLLLTTLDLLFDGRMPPCSR
jgi:hypothetical protein